VKSLHDDQIPQEIDPESDLPIGPRLANPRPAPLPERVVLDGRFCRLEPIEAKRHRTELFEAARRRTRRGDSATSSKSLRAR
jgi:hypothetical protein